MTDQPHTPTTDRIRDLFTFAVAWDAEPTKPHIFAMQENARDEFDRWLAERDAAIEAAAEQRGAVRHLREVASELNMHHLTEDLSDEALELGVRYINLIQDRADQIANKEGDIA